jgi:uncharacterized iron-regulated membrane protein
MVASLQSTIIIAVIVYACLVIVFASLVTWRERSIIAAARKKIMWNMLKQ